MNTKTNPRKRSWIPLNERRAERKAILLLLLLCLATNPTLAQTYTVLHDFSGNDGASPEATLVLSNMTLYGTALLGGISNNGTLFKINTDGSSFTVLKKFIGGADGALPLGRLVLAGTTLYGTTQSGGLGINRGGGTVFKVNTDGTGFTVIHAFTYGSDAFWPEAGLLLSDTTLYGTTEISASPYYGAVFKVNIDGSGYQVLKTLGSGDGANPRAELLLSGTTLYGTTGGHAFPGNGTVFKVNTDGSGFAVLKELSNIGSCNRLSSPVVLSGNTLYGTASEDNYYGMVFKMNTDGSGFTAIKTITNNYGAWGGPGVAGPVLSGKTLYATTPGSIGLDQGSTNYPGTVFQLNTDGQCYLCLKSFTFYDGAGPAATLLLSGATLYGTTYCGGISNFGVIFSLSIAPPTMQTPPESQTAEIGSTVGFDVEVTGSLALTYQWFFNGTNAISGVTTNSYCELTNVQSGSCGAYNVIVSNIFGAATSSPAMLNVIPAVQHRPVPGVKVTGETSSLLNVDYANALRPAPHWTTLGSVSLTSTSQYYFDLTLPLPPQRYYRAWWTGASGAVPPLDLHMIPAITLTGNIGGAVRLDYINQIGPTDAWATLDTVTLTNTSQLYFDVSAWRQPQRLYRLVQVP
jgi:uncharacterized repeat protein (TIGR03803 family)